MKEGKVFKRILAVALVVVMTITMVPFGVFAAEGTGDAPATPITPENCEHVKVLETKVEQVNPTCTQDGMKAYYACVCGAKIVYYSNIPKLETDATLKIDKLGHKWADATCTEAKHCTRTGCGATEGAALGHTGGTATCTSAAECTRCNETYGVPAEHSYEEEYTEDIR